MAIASGMIIFLLVGFPVWGTTETGLFSKDWTLPLWFLLGFAAALWKAPK